MKSKFLVKFLHTTPVLKLICKELLLSSIPNDDGVPEEDELTNLIIQFTSMLLSWGDIQQRRKLWKVMHSFQIVSVVYKR